MRGRPAIRLDDKDQIILRQLREDGRITNKDLAACVGLSKSACFERVRKLERAGIIRGYGAHLSPALAESRCQILANIALLDLPQSTRDAFDALAGACINVVAIFHVSGAFDCVLHFASDEVIAWKHFCSEMASIGVGVERVSFGLILNANVRSMER